MNEGFGPISIEVRSATIGEIIDLRYAVLIAGRPRSDATFTGDDAETTQHFGAFAGGENIGCATYMLNTWEGEPAWQLRGMATAAGWRGRGVGRVMIETAERELKALSPVRVMWCQARQPAIGFYERRGWTVVSELYVIEHYGPHVKMCKRLG